MIKLAEYEDVVRVRTDMCQFGMESHIDKADGDKGPVLKPTGFLTNSVHIAGELEKRCNDGHSHVHLMGGRAAGAAIYPPRLCEAICRGLVLHKEHDCSSKIMSLPLTTDRLMDMGNLCLNITDIMRTESDNILGISNIQVEGVNDQNYVEHFESWSKHRRDCEVVPKGAWPEHWIDRVHEPDGHALRSDPNDSTGEDMLAEMLSTLTLTNGQYTAFDDVTSAALDPQMVWDARKLEMKFFDDMGVYKRIKRSEMVSAGGKTIKTMWIDINKGDIEKPNYRSRLVGKEFRTHPDDSLYASTPPLEALRLIVSRAATKNGRTGKMRQIMINDVSRAYFYAAATRDAYIDLPNEDAQAGGDLVGKLQLCLYGTRDAATNWQSTLSAHLEKIGFRRGIAFPAVFWHEAKDIWTLVHGDDYCSTAEGQDLDWMEGDLGQ